MTVARLYPLAGVLVGYALVICFNPVRVALRDGLRCVARFERIWLTFALLGFGYTVFQFLTFSPLSGASPDFQLQQFSSIASWHWPRFTDVWGEVPLPALECVAGLFDSATTTYPLSVVAAILLIANWRGVHRSFVRAVRRRYGGWGWLIYFVVVLSALAAVAKPIVYWRLPAWGASEPAARVLQIAASIDAVAFIFEYLLGVFIQVYLITVCLAWVKGLSFVEVELFQFAMRRFSYVLEWAGVVVIVSTLLVRAPLLLAYFRDVPNVLDYLPAQRAIMSGLIILFASVQISLVLHNETLGKALTAHREFLRRNAGQFGWFLLVSALHFFLLVTADAIVRGAIGDQAAPLILWKALYVLARAFLTGWLLAAWVRLFRQCEAARIGQESWIAF